MTTSLPVNSATSAAFSSSVSKAIQLEIVNLNKARVTGAIYRPDPAFPRPTTPEECEVIRAACELEADKATVEREYETASRWRREADMASNYGDRLRSQATA